MRKYTRVLGIFGAVVATGLVAASAMAARTPPTPQQTSVYTTTPATKSNATQTPADLPQATSRGGETPPTP